MTDAQQAIRDYLGTARDEQVRFLAELVKVPSDNPAGDCAPHAKRAAELLEAMGLTVERHPVPTELVRANGMVTATNLIVRRRFGDGPVVALNAHGDVVPPGEGWTRDPYGAEVVDGWMYGRGVAVSKSDFASYAYALLALEKAGLDRGTVELHLTYDEEAGGEIGPKWLLDEGLTKPDFAIAAGFSYAVVTAHNGCLHLEVEVTGKSAHAALPMTGIDALEAATAVLNALYEHRKGFGGTVSATPGIGSPQLTVGLIKGGINTNVVPDRVTLRLDRRMIPEENPETVEAGLRALIAEAVQAVPRARVEVRRILLARPLTPLPGTDRLAEILCGHASRVMGEPVGSKGVPLYTDARHYADAGVPIVLFGAGPHTIEEANAHRADERLPLSDLFKATEVVALSLFDLLKAG
ncbi:M20/M25/M40 family metallo-hydrolase [Azospirillum soli]|uniref:M20/M25/M40 family metallo-hydrolase n=1 Tax=Azospirillum soli TaxID=1304799 RepID=UPI001AE349A0|nr:M20/M25/M40 family metallo-hydrolase [Azospirillum soli]MBP2312870.1 acetylornithine deacetylase/succinyl-diaminopimelate desuccinylase-like protein [Azospirillum soli]